MNRQQRVLSGIGEEANRGKHASKRQFVPFRSATVCPVGGLKSWVPARGVWVRCPLSALLAESLSCSALRARFLFGPATSHRDELFTYLRPIMQHRRIEVGAVRPRPRADFVVE